MAIYLDVRTALSTVQQALVDTIHLGLGWRLPAVADLAALRSSQAPQNTASAPGIMPRALRYVTAEGVVYRWLPTSALLHQPPAVVQPADRSGNGRWIRQSSTETLGPAYFRPLHRVQTGYARAVQLFQGESDEMLDRIFGVRPAFLVEWVSDDLEIKGGVQGGLYEANYSFVVHCLSQNLRYGPEILQPSPIDDEADQDPGINRMIGDLRYLLAGCRLDLAPAVKYVDIQGQAKIGVADLAQRVFVAEVPLTVRASFNIPDEDLSTPEVWVQTQMADTGGADSFDPDNFVQSGYQITPASGLTGTPTAGIAKVSGSLVATTPAPHLFTASRDTYRDLRTTGELLYTAVEVDADPPDQEAGTLRIGMTRTDASSIVSDTLLCCFAIDSGEAFQVA